MITRYDFMKAIYDNEDEWSCQSPCPHRMEEENSEDACMKCAEQKLKEYEDSIRRQTLKEVESAMYHEAFEVDHDEDGMQKWDGGNWIRYKLFEKVMEQMKGEQI